MKTIDLFSGCGGMSLGFQNAGYEIIVACDNWDKAIENYKLNFEHPILDIDLSDIEQSLSALEPYSPDVIIGGPPCQDFSIAGTRRMKFFEMDGERARLTISFAEIVKEKQPRFFIMENVPHAKKSRTYQEAAKIFHDSGYTLHGTNLNAKFCGVPQNRIRFFVIGELNNQTWNIVGLLHQGLSSLPTTMIDYFPKELKETDTFFHHQRNYDRPSIFSVKGPAPTIRGQHRPKPLPHNYRKNYRDAGPIADALDFTSRERALIQTFPMSFKFTGFDRHLNQMIGNAVPVKMAEYIAATLKPIIEKETQK